MRIITPFRCLRHKLKKKVAIRLKDGEISWDNIKELLKKDRKKRIIYNAKGINGKTLSFLIYLGKTPNYLNSEERYFDLLSLIFLNRLEKIQEKFDVKFNIIFENQFFDENILRVDLNWKKSVKIYEKFAERMNLNVRFINLKRIFDKIPNFYDIFWESIKNVKIFENSEVFNIFYFSYPTKSFGDAIRKYLEKKKEIRDWATETSKRYMAFIFARKVVNFWNYVDGVRTTVSEKPGVPTIDVTISGMSFVHGAAYLKKCLRNWRFYDVVLDNAKYRLWYRDRIFLYS